MARTIHDARFTDVPADNQFYREITWIAARQIDCGYQDGTFRPLNNMDRATMAAYLPYERLAVPHRPPSFGCSAQPPLLQGDCGMKAQGITTGWPDGMYRPRFRTVMRWLRSSTVTLVSPEHTAPRRLLPLFLLGRSDRQASSHSLCWLSRA